MRSRQHVRCSIGPSRPAATDPTFCRPPSRRLQTRERIDWPRVAATYQRLAELTASPVVELNHAAALAQAGHPDTALRAVERLELHEYLYYHSTRGELLRRLGRDEEARAAYRRALDLANSTPERRFLARRLQEV